MKIVDDKCPYCSSLISEKPGKVKRDINCSSCNRILTLQPLDVKGLTVNTEGFKTLEPGILLSFLVSVAVALDSSFLTIIFAILGSLLMVFLSTNEAVSGLPVDLQERVHGSAARLKVFPFELYLIAFWLVVVVCQLAGFFLLKSVIVSVMMLLSAIMALQANRLYLDKKISTSDLSLSDFTMFCNILIDPQTAFEKKRYEGVSVDSKESGELFSKSAAKKQAMNDQNEIDQNDNELQEKRDICSMERKKWEDDMLCRYNAWLDEESSRLLTEKH
jgi:hypothetical protein